MIIEGLTELQMEYKITREALQNDLLYDALEALDKVGNKLRLNMYVFGSQSWNIARVALDMPVPHRKAADLDMAVELNDWSQYEPVVKELSENGFVRGVYSRFRYKGKNMDSDYIVDVVPFGELADEDGNIAWPPKGRPKMVVGFLTDAVMNAADTVVFDDTFTVKTAPLSGQFVINFDKWIQKRLDKDVGDMLYTMRNFYSAFAGIKPVPDEVKNAGENSDSLTKGAIWIAYEMRGFLSPKHLHFYTARLMKEIELDKRSPLIKSMRKMYPAKDSHTIIKNTLIGMAEVLRKGLPDNGAECHPSLLRQLFSNHGISRCHNFMSERLKHSKILRKILSAARIRNGRR